MIPHRFLALVSFLPLTLACQSAYAAPGGANPKPPPAGLLPPAKGPIELQVEGQVGPNLALALERLSAATGVHFTAHEHVRQQLASTDCGLLTSVSVPAAEAWVWVESLLQHEGFVLGILSADAPQLVAVYPLVPQGGRPFFPAYHTVPVSQIEALAEHPAVLVSTTLELPHTDVRQLGNSLRGLTTDPTGQQTVVPVGNSNSVILTGTGRGVLQLVTMLREVEAAQAAAWAEAKARGAEVEAATETPGAERPR